MCHTACEQDKDGTGAVLILLASCQQTCMTYTFAVCAVKTPDDGQRNCTKRVEFYSKNKSEKLVYLIRFIIRFCHNARSPERQSPLSAVLNETNTDLLLSISDILLPLIYILEYKRS